MYCLNHPGMEVSRLFLENMSPRIFWSISNKFPDLVKHLHQQLRLTGNYGLNGGVPWLRGSSAAFCFFCKEEVEDCAHFLLRCKTFKANFSSLWQNLYSKILRSNPDIYTTFIDFSNNLDDMKRILFLLGGLSLPFDHETSLLIRRFIASAVGKICKIRFEKLRELEAPWLS